MVKFVEGWGRPKSYDGGALPRRVLSFGSRAWYFTTFLVWLMAVMAVVALPQCGSAKTTIKLWINHGVEEEPLFVEVVKQFEKLHPDIEVDLSNTPTGDQDNYYVKVTTAAVAGTLADVFYVRPGTDRRFAAEGFVYDIDPLVRRDAEELRIEDFIGAQIPELQYQGKWWALPYDLSSIGLWYNADLFDQMGLRYPDDNWTWPDVIEAARKLTRRSGEKTAVWGLGDVYDWWMSQYLEGFLLTEGGRLFNDDYTKCAITEPASINALKMIADVSRTYHVAPWPNEANRWLVFSEGRAAMTLDGSWSVLQQRKRNRFTFDVTMLPRSRSGKRVVSATGGGWAISRKTAHIDAAWELVKFLASPAALRVLIVQPARSLPPRQSLLREWVAEVTKEGQSPRQAWIFAEQVIRYGRNVPLVTFPYQNVLWAQADALFFGSIPVEEVAAGIAHQIDLQIQRALRTRRG